MKQLSKKRYREILEETVEFYGEDPKRKRAVHPGNVGCAYLSENGNKCAVGRLLRPEHLHLDLEGSVSSLASQLSNSPIGLYDEENQFALDPYLLDEYQGLDLYFLQYLQNLHDFKNHWTNQGLSEKGKKYYEIIKRKISDNQFHEKSTK